MKKTLAFFYDKVNRLNLESRLQTERMPLQTGKKTASEDKKAFRFSRLPSMALALLLVLGMIPAMPVIATTTQGKVDIDKTATVVGDYSDRTYEITLSVSGNAITSSVASDVVLVLDTSGSMGYNLSGSTTRLAALKTAAKAFVDDVLDANAGNRVALVKYNGDKQDNDTPYDDAQILKFGTATFSNTYSSISGKIDGLSAAGGTNMEAGFLKASKAMTASTAGNKIVVFMTDGEPTYYYANGSSDGRNTNSGFRLYAAGKTLGLGNSYDVTAKNRAIAAALQLKNSGAKIFTVGLIAGTTTPADVAAVLNPTGISKYQEQYFQTSTAAGLSSIYSYLSTVVSSVGNNAVVNDVIADGFTYVVGSMISSDINSTFSVTGSTVIWNLGNVTTDIKMLKFKVRAADSIYGASHTNSSATLSFNPISGNPYYAGTGTQTLIFPKPVVAVAPIAVDEQYGTRQGTVLTVNAATGVLANDLSKIKKEVSAMGWTATNVSAVLANAATYGSVVLSPDGSFIYTPYNSTNTATDTFQYNILTTVTKNDGTTLTLTSKATATIVITPLYPVTVGYVEKIGAGYSTIKPTLNGPSLAAGESYDYSATPVIADYTYSKELDNKALTGSMGSSALSLTLVYTRNPVGSTIKYYQDTLSNKVAVAAGPSGAWGSQVTLTQDLVAPKTGYTATIQAPATITLDKDASKNVFKVLYTKNAYTYSIAYYIVGRPAPVDTLPNQSALFGTVITGVPASPAIPAGLSLNDGLSDLPFTVAATNDQIIKVYYESSPVAVDDTANTTYNTPVTINVLGNDTDADGDTLTATSITQPVHGTAVLNQDGTVTYTPDLTAADQINTFTYSITDGIQGHAATATVSVTVSEIPNVKVTVQYLEQGTNTPLQPEIQTSVSAQSTYNGTTPVIEGYHVVSGHAATWTAAVGDVDLTVKIYYSKNSYEVTVNYWTVQNSGSPFDTATITGLLYHDQIASVVDPATVPAGATRVNSLSTEFPYTVIAGSNVINIYYALNPVAVDDSATINPGQATTLSVLDNDTDTNNTPSTLRVQSVVQPLATLGTVSFNNSTLTFTPAAGVSGQTVVFTYTVVDQYGKTDQADVTITIRPYYSITVNYYEEGTTNKIADSTVNSTALYGNPYSEAAIAITGFTLQGASSFSTDGATGLTGNIVWDFYYARNAYDVTVNYLLVNTATPFDTAELADRPFASILVESQIPAPAALPIGAAKVTVPASTVLPYTVSAGENIINVYYAQAPIAVNDTAETNPGTAVEIDVLNNDSDPNATGDDSGNNLTITGVTVDPLDGTAEIIEGKIVFTPAASLSNRLVTLSYEITNAYGLKATATITVTVLPYYTVTINYLEQLDGSTTADIRSSDIQTGLVDGSSYNVETPAIAGFTWLSTLGETSGAIDRANVEITFIYTRDFVPEATTTPTTTTPAPTTTRPETLISETSPLPLSNGTTIAPTTTTATTATTVTAAVTTTTTTAPVETLTPSNEPIPQTGEQGSPAVVIGVILLILAGGLTLILRRRKGEH